MITAKETKHITLHIRNLKNGTNNKRFFDDYTSMLGVYMSADALFAEDRGLSPCLRE